MAPPFFVDSLKSASGNPLSRMDAQAETLVRRRELRRQLAAVERRTPERMHRKSPSLRVREAFRPRRENNMNRLKTSTKLVLLAVFASTVLALLGLIGAFQMHRMATAMIEDLHAAKVENEALVAVENAQAHFKTQVQEWKNILLRGNDAANYDRYLKQFSEEEARVQGFLAAAGTGMSTAGLAVDGVDKLRADHLQMGQRYRSALEQFDKTDTDAGKIVDKLVRGMDRDAAAGMAQIVTEIEAHFAARVAAQIDQAQARYESARNTFAGLTVLGLVLSIGLCIAVLRDMFGQLGGEPAYAADIARRIAAGDLTTSIDTRRGDQSSLLVAMRHMRDSQREVITQIQQAASRLAEAAGQMSLASNQVSVGSGRQSEAAAAMAASVEEMSSSIRHVATNANEVHGMAAEAGSLSATGGCVVKDAVAEINKIADSFNRSSDLISSLGDQSGRISAIVNVIKEIAEQTNLLALNAAIEAARAGEQGRGFAVVADEVRVLSRRTQDSTQEIQSTIETLQQTTARAVSLMQTSQGLADNSVKDADAAAAALEEITQAVSLISDMAGQIATAAEEQTQVTGEITQNTTAIKDVSDEITASAMRDLDQAHNLKGRATNLNQQVSTFIL